MDSRTLKLKMEYPTYLNQLNTGNVRLGPWIWDLWNISAKFWQLGNPLLEEEITEFDLLALNLHRQKGPLYEIKDAWAILAKKEVWWDWSLSFLLCFILSFFSGTEWLLCKCYHVWLPTRGERGSDRLRKAPSFHSPPSTEKVLEQEWWQTEVNCFERALGGTHHLQAFSCWNCQQLSQMQQQFCNMEKCLPDCNEQIL